jgi:hypothetical protein
MKGFFFKNIFLYFWLLLEPCIEIWRFFLNFGQILATENLRKHLILALSIFIIIFSHYIASEKRVMGGWESTTLDLHF